VAVQKIFTPILKAKKHLGKNKKFGEIQNVKEQKAKSGRDKSCTEIRK
jgi:hypothetical protein